MRSYGEHRIRAADAISSRWRPARWLALLVCVSASALVATASAAAVTYSVTDLGSLGFGSSFSLALNNTGQVTGYSYLSKEFEVPCPPQRYGRPKRCFENPYHAFLWSNGTISDLGTLGGHFSQGNSISLSGEVVGTSGLSSGFSDGFLWNGQKMIDLGRVIPYGINDSGEIAGVCADPVGNFDQPCVISKGETTDLPNPTNLDCNEAVAINNNGQVLGDCGDSSGDLHAVVWTNGTPTVLPTLGGPTIAPTAINNQGQVVGHGQTSTFAQHGFLFSNGTITDLGNNVFPAAINDSGVIVFGPFVDTDGTIQNLNNLVPAGSPQITSATAINDNGQIAVASGGEALLLTPN